MTTEEKIVELEKELALLKQQVETLKDDNKELKQNHKELRDKHVQLADNSSTHQGLSKVLHIATPILGIIGAYVINKIRTLSLKTKDSCGNCQNKKEIKKENN